MSDLHFGKDHYFNDSNIALWFNKLKDILSAKRIQPDLLCISGDVASVGSKDDFLSAQKFIQEELLDYFKIPLVIVPGNHDLKWAVDSSVEHFNRFGNYLNFLHNLNKLDDSITTKEYFEKPHFYTKITEKKNSCSWIEFMSFLRS